jgi:hypothetical protein
MCFLRIDKGTLFDYSLHNRSKGYRYGIISYGQEQSKSDYVEGSSISSESSLKRRIMVIDDNSDIFTYFKNGFRN